jgi:hypothetical protein
MAAMTYEICQKARSVNLADNLNHDFINQWVGFYDAPESFMQSLFEFLTPEVSPDELGFIPNLFNQDDLNEWLRTSMMGVLSDPKTDLLEEMKKPLSVYNEEKVPDRLPDLFFDKCKTEPRILFYFKVWFPCWIEYCEFLPALMTKARNGETQALEQLIRLDPVILNHPKISLEYQKIRFNNPLVFNRLCKAQQGKGLKELTPTNVKYLFGAYIYRLLKTMDSRFQLVADQFGVCFPKMAMSAETIFALFNKQAKQKQGSLYDPDFESISAFKAGISRHQSYWDNSFQ